MSRVSWASTLRPHVASDVWRQMWLVNGLASLVQCRAVRCCRCRVVRRGTGTVNLKRYILSLYGSRMGRNNIFRLEGTQLTMMSRPWTELYGLDGESAEYIKKIIDLGAVIVDKTKMTSFASLEEPTHQWIDFHCPVIPRGDRYQSPSSSSPRAGTSLADHDWLDFSIAGDYTILPQFCLPPHASRFIMQLLEVYEHPHPCSGLFSSRPSFDSTSTKAIPANSPYGSSGLGINSWLTPGIKYSSWQASLVAVWTNFTTLCHTPRSTMTMRARKSNPDHFGFYNYIVHGTAGTFTMIAQKSISSILHAPQLMLPWSRVWSPLDAIITRHVMNRL